MTGDPDIDLGAASIRERLSQPSAKDVRMARLKAGLTQAEAAKLVSSARRVGYKTWASYETPEENPNHRAIPLATWELFLLFTHQHREFVLVRRKPTRRDE